jgi:hypothetical protein
LEVKVFRGRRSIAAGVLTAAAISTGAAGFAITGTAFASERGCRPMSPPVSRPVNHRHDGDDNHANRSRDDDRCQVSPPVSRPVGEHHHHHHGDQDNNDQGDNES